MISIRVDDDVSSALTQAANSMSNVTSSAHDKMGQRIVAVARARHRYRNRTGKLSSSIKYDADQEQVEVYLDTSLAEYGDYIHDGTKHIAGDPFLQNAVDSATSSNLRDLDEALAKQLKQAGLDVTVF